MKNWKISIVCQNKTIDAQIKAKTYSDAYIKAGTDYPDCIIKSVSEVRIIIKP